MEQFNNLYNKTIQYFNNLADYIVKSFYYYPGEGEIFKIKKTCYIKHPEKNLRLNYIKLPDLDNQVGLFEEDIQFSKKNYTLEEFDTVSSGKKIYFLYKYSIGIIDDVFHTKNIKEGDLVGFISSPLYDDVYIFKIKEGLIDFREIFEMYKMENN